MESPVDTNLTAPVVHDGQPAETLDESTSDTKLPATSHDKDTPLSLNDLQSSPMSQSSSFEDQRGADQALEEEISGNSLILENQQLTSVNNLETIAGVFGDHVNQAKIIIDDLRERLQYSKRQASESAQTVDLAHSLNDPMGTQLEPEEEGLALLMHDQQLLQSKLQVAKESQNNDEHELKNALKIALEASRQQNKELRESLANLNMALTGEIARRTNAEKDLTIALQTLQAMKQSDSPQVTVDHYIFEKLRKHEEECEQLRAQLEAKMLSSVANATPADPILQIRAEINQLQEKRAEELATQISQLEDEIAEYEGVITDLRDRVVLAQRERDEAKREVARLSKELEVRDDLIVQMKSQPIYQSPVASPVPREGAVSIVESMPQPQSPQFAPFGGPNGERVVQQALDQRDAAFQRLDEAEGDLHRLRETMRELENAMRDQQEEFDQQKQLTEAQQIKKQDQLWRGWTSATQQMMKKVSKLEMELEESKQQADTRPSLLAEALAANPTNPTLRTMNVLATKDKERDSFVATTMKLHDFIEKVIRLEASSQNNLELALIIKDAKEMLMATNAIMDLHSLPDGWEARLTKEGLTYYIDHINKTSTWIHPKLGSDFAPVADYPSMPPLASDQSANSQSQKRISLLKRLKNGLKNKKSSRYAVEDNNSSFSSIAAESTHQRKESFVPVL